MKLPQVEKAKQKMSQDPPHATLDSSSFSQAHVCPDAGAALFGLAIILTRIR